MLIDCLLHKRFVWCFELERSWTYNAVSLFDDVLVWWMLQHWFECLRLNLFANGKFEGWQLQTSQLCMRFADILRILRTFDLFPVCYENSPLSEPLSQATFRRKARRTFPRRQFTIHQQTTLRATPSPVPKQKATKHKSEQTRKLQQTILTRDFHRGELKMQANDQADSEEWTSDRDGTRMTPFPN